jgi:hypothetical protein
VPRFRILLFGVFVAAATLTLPQTVQAQQVFESAGARALGMGGAFVAVSDDASAVFWNPAGLPSAGPAGLTIGWVEFRTGDQKAPANAGPTRRTSTSTSLGTWPMGISYITSTQTFLTQPAGAGVRAESLRTSQFGATVLQTVVPRCVVAATLKYVRGSAVESDATGLSTSDALEKIDNVGGQTSGAFDVDVAAMIDVKPVRVGLTIKNLRQPTFHDSSGLAMSLEREMRAGVAVMPNSGLTLALDIDLQTVDLQDGQRRMLALGGEQRISSRLVARGGVRWNLKQRDLGAATAIGASVLVQPHLWLDAHYTRGGILADRGFGTALRVGF